MQYFEQNRYNLKIFTAKVGNYSILQWFGLIYFNSDGDPSFYNHDKAQYIQNEYLYFAFDCGYMDCDELKDFINKIINNHVPLEEYISNEKEKYQNIIDENSALKSKNEEYTHTLCVPYYKATPYNIPHTKFFLWRKSLEIILYFFS